VKEGNYEKLNLHERNEEARQTNPCINPQCENFVDIGNSYDLYELLDMQEWKQELQSFNMLVVLSLIALV